MPATSSPQHWAGQRQAVRGTGRPQATTLHASQLGHTSCIMRPREEEVEPHTWRVPGPHTDIPLCWAGSGGLVQVVVFPLVVAGDELVIMFVMSICWYLLSDK